MWAWCCGCWGEGEGGSECVEAFSDPTRRALLEQLRRGPRPVSALVSAVDVSQPAVSQHLRVLRQARLVRVRKAGRQRIYSLNPEGLSTLRAYIDSFWQSVLEAYQQAAQQQSQEKHHGK